MFAFCKSFSKVESICMFLTIASVLTDTDLPLVHERLDSLNWQDGARTAGGRARLVKKNQQADLRSKPGQGLHDFLSEAIERTSVFQSAARPKKLSRLLISRTENGGGYGAHVDNALMNGLRTDLSFTLFLSDPESYEGGELIIDLPGGTHSAKPAAGDLVLYPSGALHKVEPVTKGTRYAVVGWVESHVRGAAEREILFDLDNTRAALGKSLDQNAIELLTLDKVASNLLRLWAS